MGKLPHYLCTAAATPILAAHARGSRSPLDSDLVAAAKLPLGFHIKKFFMKSSLFFVKEAPRGD
jgi:hypothetical protein